MAPAVDGHASGLDVLDGAWSFTARGCAPARRGFPDRPGEGVVETGVEAARAACADRGVLTGDAERSQRLDGSVVRLVREARNAPVIAVDMQPVPLTMARSSCPLETADRSPSETWSTGPVTEATRPSVRAASRASSAASPPAAIDSTPRTSASTPTSVAISPAFPRRTRHVELVEHPRAVSVR